MLICFRSKEPNQLIMKNNISNLYLKIMQAKMKSIDIFEAYYMTLLIIIHLD